MSPFDAARYARLLEGLEVTEQSLSTLERTLRIDAEFFQRKYLNLETKLASLNWQSIADIAAISDGNHFSISNAFVEDGIPYYRGQDVAGYFFVEQAHPNTIHHAAFDTPQMRRSHLQQGDVLLSIVGTVGEASLVKTTQEATCSCKLAILRPRDVDPAYLATVLVSKVGRSLSARWKRGAVQMGLLLEDMDQIPIPRFSRALESLVAETVSGAFDALESSQRLIDEAENSIQHVLGLENWKAPEPLSYVRQSSEIFVAGRMDAQHFQPRFKALTDFIDGTGQGARLGSRLSENQRGKQPEYVDEGLPVVNSKHVLRGEVRLDGNNRHATFTDDDLLIHQGDVLLNGTGVGTIGRAAPYLHAEPAIPDNHVTILRCKPGLDAVYLAVFLNSMAGQWQVEQRLRGSSGQIELYPSDIAEFRVWVAPPKVQANIRRAVEKSHEQKQRATQLLDAAKRAVEIAIESSEAAALAYLDQAALPAH